MNDTAKKDHRVVQDGSEKEKIFSTPCYFSPCIPEITFYYIYDKNKTRFIAHRYLKTTSSNDKFFSQFKI